MLGKFIVIEGTDGSGKTTQVQKLVAYLIGKRKHVIATKEPTEASEYSKEIRKILRSSKDASDQKEELTKLFVEDRKLHLKEFVEPSLEKGITVVSDRYYLSTLAYQHTQGMDLNYLMKLHEGMIRPDIMIVIDVDIEEAEKRIKSTNRNVIEIFENPKEKKFKKALSENYIKIAKKLRDDGENIFIVNGNRSVDEIFENIKKLVDTVLVS